MNDTKVIILAAGKGTRINDENHPMPKVLREAHGRPLISYVIAIAAIALTRYVSLGSMLCLVSYAVIVCCFYASAIPGVGPVWVILWAVLLAALCLIRHHANIGRLLSGKENKISFKKKKD